MDLLHTDDTSGLTHPPRWLHAGNYENALAAALAAIDGDPSQHAGAEGTADDDREAKAV